VKSLSDCRLYTFVDTAYLRGRSPEELARPLCDGGSDLIQLRAKGSSADAIRCLAERLLPVTERAGIGLVINDHPRIAREIGAPLCHLGQEDFFAAGHTHTSELRPLDSKLQIGLSTHAVAQGERALAAGADYLAIGPVHATPTKPAARPVTLELVRWAAARVSIPWFAIGGITLQNLDEVLAAGARCVCVVSAILNAPDVAGACRQFKDRLLASRGACPTPATLSSKTS